MEEVVQSALAEEQALWDSAINGDVAEEAAPAPAAESSEPQEAPEPEPTTEPAETPAESEKPTEQTEDAPQPKERESKSVPLAALLEERDKRHKAEQELAVFQAQENERRRILAEQQAQQQQQAVQTPEEAINAEVEKRLGKRPDENEDVVAAAEWDQKAATERSLIHAQQAERIAEATRMRVELDTDRNAFIKVKPDYQDALKHVVEQRKQFYMLSGANEQEAVWLTNMDAGRLIDGARRQGKSVAETIYKLAELTGYKAPEAAPVPAPAPKPPTAEEKLASVEEGQKVISLNRGSHAPSATELTDSQIDNMSSQELHKWLQNPKNAARYRKMLGEE